MASEDQRSGAAGPERDAGLARARSMGVKAWAFVGVALVFGIVVWALGFVVPALELVLAGVVMGFVCSPLTNFLEDHGVGRAVGALVAVAVLIAVIAIIMVLLVPPFVTQLIAVLRRVPSYVVTVRTTINRYWSSNGGKGAAEVQQQLDQIVNAVSDIGLKASSELIEKLSNGLVSSAVSFANGLVTFFLGLVLAYWLAKDYPSIARECRVIAGPRHEGSLSVLLAVMSRSMGGYMWGAAVTSVFDGVASFLAFAIAGHPYAGLCAIMIGAFHFVPVVGAWVAVALATVLALFESPMLAIVTLVASIVIQNVTDNVVSPLVMRSAVKIHPVLSLVGLVIGNSLGGILGMVLAIPLTAAIKSVFVYYFESRSGRQLVSYDGALFQGRPFHDGEGKIEAAFDALDDDTFFRNTRLVDASSKRERVSVVGERPAGHRRTLSETVASAARAAVGRRKAVGSPRAHGKENDS